MNVDIRGLSVTYENKSGYVKAIEGLNLSVKSGEICTIIGPSGCGKTTLIYVLSGIIKDYRGEALMDGESVDPRRQSIGLIPQNYGLFEWADVYRNVTLGIKHKKAAADTNRQVANLLSQIRLFGTEHKYPCSLSGGERQRVAIARAFIMKPDILLMDEPFSALDAITREEAQDLFLDVWGNRPATALIVTHSIEEAVYLGQRIAVMTCAPGRILQVIENPLFGSKGLRTSAEYCGAVIALRKKVKELWQTCESQQ